MIKDVIHPLMPCSGVYEVVLEMISFADSTLSGVTLSSQDLLFKILHSILGRDCNSGGAVAVHPELLSGAVEPSTLQ